MTLTPCRVNEIHSPARLSQTEVDWAFGVNADRRVGLPGSLAAGEFCHEGEGHRNAPGRQLRVSARAPDPEVTKSCGVRMGPADAAGAGPSSARSCDCR